MRFLRAGCCGTLRIRHGQYKVWGMMKSVFNLAASMGIVILFAYAVSAEPQARVTARKEVKVTSITTPVNTLI